MGRRASGYWDDRSGQYFVRLGEVSEKSGKRKPRPLLYDDGTPVAFGDDDGREQAIERIQAAIAKADELVKSPNVDALVRMFLVWHRERGSKPRTIYTHRWNLFKFIDFEHDGVRYGSRSPASITLADLTRFRKAMKANGWETGTIRIAYAAILAMWHWACRPVEDRDPPRLLDVNPFADLERPKKGKGRKLILPWATIRALVEFAETRTPTIFRRDRVRDVSRCLALRLIAETGCRPHEASELQWDWVFEGERVLVIPAEATKTGKEDRIVGLPDEVAARLAKLRHSGNAHKLWVFAMKGDRRTTPPLVKRIATWFNAVKADAAKAEPPLFIPETFTLYSLRHSFVSQARAGGIDLRELAPGMGHSADVAERVYAHAQIIEIRELMDRARAARERAA